MKKLLQRLAWCSEKAAHLARACRSEQDLFQLLVEEKSSGHGFSQDFKTLADVLIQETVRNDLSKTFPGLADNILGEENCQFTNTLGENIHVKVCATESETSSLLCKILDGHKVAADILAKEVHATFNTDIIDIEDVPEEDCDVTELGIWIDPIDGTNNYINGEEQVPAENPVERTGLSVVTVLIGVFNRKTGAPVAGVVNQPFYSLESGKWSGKIHWGVTLSLPDGQTCRRFSRQPSETSQIRPQTAVISTRESSELRNAVKNCGFDFVFASGAGYKILLLVLGCVDAYITTRTYKWDTCAGHAILDSMGGGLVDLETGQPVVYHKPGNETDPWANFGILVAFRNDSVLDKLKPLLNVAK